MIRILLMTLSILTMPVVLHAQTPEHGPVEGMERLTQFLDGLTTFSADFEQRVLDADKVEIDRSKGTMVLRRNSGGAGQFRWVYTEPYPQIIISDGVVLWLYDEDLEQVTVRNMDDSISRSPAMVLTSDIDPRINFEVTELGHRNNESLQWIELKPKTSSTAKNTDYDFIWLGFDGDQLVSMELIDGFGQTTRMTFSQIQRNPDVNANTFVFEIPEGVDVVSQQEPT